MAERKIAPLPRLRAGEDVVEWSRELIDQLQSILMGRISVIDGRAILDQSIPPEKMKP